MSQEETLPKKEDRFKGIVRPLQARDLPDLKPILETWLRFPTITGELLTEELQTTLGEIEKSLIHENKKQFYVAQSPDGTIAGMMGIQPPDFAMMTYSRTVHPVEIINAYVHFDERQGKGVGRALVSAVENESRTQGFEELLLNSGPRYRETGWPFWKKMFGEPIGQLTNRYGEGLHAPVWRKPLN